MCPLRRVVADAEHCAAVSRSLADWPDPPEWCPARSGVVVRLKVKREDDR
jgi:hypothetical protein